MSSPAAPDRRVLVSACLLGRPCRYDGRHTLDRPLERELAERGEQPVLFCPEEHGGLGTPRPSAWLTGPAAEVLAGRARVRASTGGDVTEGFVAGARGALDLCRAQGISKAYLKERSPSCGCLQTHVDGVLVDGAGVTGELLRQNGIEIEGVEGRRD